jgi:hypothetical protein
MLPEGTEIPTQYNSTAKDKLGVYEGGGYVSKGVYRPCYNCVMNNFHTIDVFCPVCIKAIKGVIEFNCR